MTPANGYRYRQKHHRRKPVSQSQGPKRKVPFRMAAGCQKYICNSSRSACTLTKEAFHMLKKNTRKRLLAGALATVMMLTMCPSWALAGDEDIAPLPLVDESLPVVDSAPVEADTTKTPADPTPSEPEAKPAEDQNTAPAPSNDGANGGTDSTESGNSTNSTVSEGSENNSQNNDVVSNAPENEISMASPDIDLASNRNTKAHYFVLLPNRNKPTSGENQGRANYLPSFQSDGGVKGCNAINGYAGSLTEVGKKAADDAYHVLDSKNGVFNADGFGSDYLIEPENLGFFTAHNWNGSTYIGKTKHNADQIKNLLKTADGDFNVNEAEVVWYAIKWQIDGYHVDGYVKNIAVDVTYHSNFGEDQIHKERAKTGDYTALTYDKTGLSTRDGYKFAGWYTDAACTNAYSGVLMSSMHLYAKWVPNNFEVSYFYQNEQGKETQFGDIDTYAFDTDVTVRTAHPEKEGYTFTGWTNIANIVTVDADGKFTMPAQDVRFDAQFSINQYHVTYKVDGKDYGNTETYVFNSDVVIRPVPTKEGYTFTGWKIGTADAENFKMPAHDVTIEGTFAINRYTVTYKVDTEVVGTDVYDFNSDVVIRDVPTKEGYTFSGWKIGTADAQNFKMPAHDVIIEGTYAKNSSGHHHRKPTVTIPDKVPTGLNGNDHYAYIVGYPDKTVRPQNGITRAEVATIFFRLLTDETRNANSTKSNSYSDVAAGAWYNHAVSTLSAMGIVKGDSNGKFNPNAPITRAEFAAIAARFDDKANSTTADFSDIVSHWAKNEISAASNNGWINGYPDGTFRPDNKITRAEAMTLVNRVLKRLPETAEDLHDDMIKWSDNSDASQWFYLAVQEATNSHYYKAKENKFEKWSELRDTRDWTELEK